MGQLGEWAKAYQKQKREKKLDMLKTGELIWGRKANKVLEAKASAKVIDTLSSPIDKLKVEASGLAQAQRVKTYIVYRPKDDLYHVVFEAELEEKDVICASYSENGKWRGKRK